MKFPHLEHAPIVEAIIDIRVEALPEERIAALEGFAKGIQDRFPKCKKRRSAQAHFELTPEGIKVAPPQNATEDGFLLYSDDTDGQLIAQARLDGFSLSRLKPYHNGDKFRAEARELWDQYVKAVAPKNVTRMAVRNVNRIEHKIGEDLEATLLTGPNIARALPLILSDYFMRMSLADLVSGGTVVISQALTDANSEMGTVQIIFDVDAFVERTLAPEAHEVWTVIDDLRDVKNRVFFNSLTVSAIERYR